MRGPLDALGAMGSVLGIISFIGDNVPDQPKVGAAARVKLGLGEKSNAHAIHSPKELCSSESSWGLDFVGLDGFFCDMGTKMLAPLCSLQTVESCVRIGHDGKTLTKRKSIAKRVVNAHHKSYGTVTHWK